MKNITPAANYSLYRGNDNTKVQKYKWQTSLH